MLMIMVGVASFLRRTFEVGGSKRLVLFFFFAGQTQNQIIQVGREEASQYASEMAGAGVFNAHKHFGDKVNIRR